MEKLTSHLVCKNGIRGVCPVGEVCYLSSHFWRKDVQNTAALAIVDLLGYILPVE